MTEAAPGPARSTRTTKPSGGGDWAWLSLVFLAFAFITTRTALVLHELVGHGVVAAALGAKVVDFRLFVFGGGMIRYERPEPFTTAEGLLVSLGGIGLQLALGGLLLLASRRIGAGLWRGLAVSAASMNIVHAGFYFVMAVHYGFGDGRLLAGRLGPARVWLVVLATGLLVAGGYALAGSLARHTAGWVRRSGRGRTLGLLVAAALAAGAVHGAAMWIEQRVAADARYANIMQHQSERDVARELAAARARQEMTPEEVEALRAELAARHRPFPLRPVVAVLLGAAALAGAYRAIGDAPRAPRPAPRALAVLAVAAVAAGVLVGLLRAPWWPGSG